MRLVVLSLIAAFSSVAAERPGDWTGRYAPCERHAELLRQGPLDIGVRFATRNPVLTAQFVRAMDFWSTVLDMDWHEDNSPGCALEVVDGTPDLFRTSPAVARAQFPGGPAFQGWIAFNPKAQASDGELYMVAVHEIGHVLGLQHNSSAWSVMYFMSLEGPVQLDKVDLAILGARHKLRLANPNSPLQIARAIFAN